MKKRLVYSLILFFIFWGISNISWASYEKYYGIYLLPTKGKIHLEALKYPFVKGVSIRIPWKVLEPQKGVFRWKKIEKIIKAAKKENKFINIRILAGFYSPEWIFQEKDIPTIKFRCRNPNKEGLYGKEVIIPVLWDKHYLKEYYRFLKALGEKFSQESALFWVAVSGPVTGPATPHLPKNPQTLELFKEKGFSKKVWLSVWKEAIDKTAEYFPQKAISLCLDVPPFYKEMAKELAEYATQKYPHRVCLQSNGLSAKVLKILTSNRARGIKEFLEIFTDFSDRAIIGFQMTWAAAWRNRGRDRLGPLDQAIEAGLKLKASYLEIYQDDIIDRKNWPILKKAARALEGKVNFQQEKIYTNDYSKQFKYSRKGFLKRLRNVLLQLDLSPEQKHEIRKSFRELREERKEGKDISEIKQDLFSKLKEILTSDQYERFEELWKESTP